MIKSKVSMIVALSLIITGLSGCTNNIASRDATSVPLTPALTKQEVLDYYSNALNYDTIITRNAEPHINNYETTIVNDTDKLSRINKILREVELILSQPNYKATDETRGYLTDSMYNYIRSMLNDKALTNSQVLEAKQAMGYYFVDVKYDIVPANIGTFKDQISLIGINGSIHYIESTNEDSVDNIFMMKAVEKLNEYFKSKNMSNSAYYDSSNHVFSISGTNGDNWSDFNNTTLGNQDTTDITSSTEGAEGSQPDTTEPQMDENGNPISNDVEPTPEPIETYTPTHVASGSKNYIARSPRIDIKLFNNIVGFGTHTAYIPNLDMIYNMPESKGISGIGLYPCGGLGLSTFGFNRENLNGECVIRYLFKEDLVDPTKLTCENIYVNYWDITSGINSNNDNIIPNFLKTEFDTLIDRADRVMINNDINGLAKGDVFNDIGMAVLNGYQRNFGNVLRQISTVRRIIARDIDNNSYLLEVETYRQEGAKSADLYASYKDTVYVVIEQDGSQYKVTDWMIMNRQLEVEPDINPDAATAKRVVALGLTGEVPETAKTEIVNLLNDLYKASTYRVLNGPYAVNDEITLEKGMYDCFNSNVEMLSSTKKEELNSNLRQLLIKNGINTSATMQGKVTEWIAGTNNQAELTTEELITYQGRSTGVYMRCYYLVSSIEDKWVIDDIQILGDMEEVSGDGLIEIQNRLAQ